MSEMILVQIYIGLGAILLATVIFFWVLYPKVLQQRYLNDKKNWQKSEEGAIYTYLPKPSYRVALRNAGNYTPGEWSDRLDVVSGQSELYIVEVWRGRKIVQLEEFVSFDGGKYFILNPTTKPDFVVQELPYLYQQSQLPIARLLGKYGESIEDFCKKAKIEIV